MRASGGTGKQDRFSAVPAHQIVGGCGCSTCLLVGECCFGLGMAPGRFGGDVHGLPATVGDDWVEFSVCTEGSAFSDPARAS